MAIPLQGTDAPPAQEWQTLLNVLMHAQNIHTKVFFILKRKKIKSIEM